MTGRTQITGEAKIAEQRRKDEKRAAALRENLRRRKMAGAERTEAAGAGSGDKEMAVTLKE